MHDQTPESQSPANRPNWWQRNWKWFVPTALFGGLILVAGFIASIILFVMTMMKSSGAYEIAMAHATENETVIQEIGEPIEVGFLVIGSIQTSGSSGTADLSIPISGPNGKATLYITAEKKAGEWQADELAVQFKDSYRLNLLAEPE